MLRLTKDAPPHSSTVDNYPHCKHILNIFDNRNHRAVPVPRSETSAGLGEELTRAPLDICERVYEAFGVSGYEDLFPMSSVPDFEEDEVSEAPEDYEDEEKRVKLRLSGVANNKRSSSSLRDSPHARSRSTGKSSSAHKTAATDTTKPRIPNQIPIVTFWNYVEAFFKPIDEADIKYLDDPTMPVDATAFVIPPLGRRYESQWRELYGFIVQTKGRSVEDQLPPPEPLPSLPNRILSMLIDQNVPAGINSTGSENSSLPDTEMECSANSHDRIHLNERICRQLHELGLRGVSPHDLQEDDPICAEMRACQSALRDHIFVNYWRKRKLAACIRKLLPMQEFYSLLLEIDKQIDAAFQRRLRANRKRKKSHADSDDLAAIPSADTVRLVENREKLVAAFKQIFPELYHALLPSPTRIIDAEMEKRVLERAKKECTFLPLPQLPESFGNGCKPTFNTK